MSSKGRAAADYVPDPNGFFATQPQVTRAVIPFLNIQTGMRILEPSCGNGAIGKVLRAQFGNTIVIVGVEIDKKRATQARKAQAYSPVTDSTLPVFDDVIHSDFYKLTPAGIGAPFDHVLTNPSFSIWLPFSEHCFQFGDETTLLLPFNALASKKRLQWWKAHPAHARILSKRPSFAISVKCIASTPDGRNLGLANCSFQELIALDAKPKRECPKCGEKTITTSSDSSEYMWASWSPGVTRGLWDVIETPKP